MYAILQGCRIFAVSVDDVTKNTLKVRQMTAADVASVTGYWYDAVVWQQQTNTHLKLSADARAEWAAYADNLLSQPDVYAFVTIDQHVVTGCLMAQRVPNRAGLLPREICRIHELIFDIHMGTGVRGAVRALLHALRKALEPDGIERVIIDVPTYAPVQQAFWRGSGARARETVFWLNL